MTDSPQETLRERLKPASSMPSSSQVSQLVGLFSKPELFFFEQYQKHGEIFKVSPPFFGSNIACLVGPEANRFLLKDRLSSRLGNAGLEPIVSTDLVQIINQIIGFLFAGHETTASLMNWILFELGNRPEWRQKLRDELQQVTGNQPLSIKHLRQLPQMSNVLKEGERLYPPVAGLARVATADIEYAGYNIPAGWYVMIFPQLTHRMPEIYQEPDLFDPDRFAAPRE
jgi:cytochrome P450